MIHSAFTNTSFAASLRTSILKMSAVTISRRKDGKATGIAYHGMNPRFHHESGVPIRIKAPAIESIARPIRTGSREVRRFTMCGLTLEP
jgi:hypothetical protein